MKAIITLTTPPMPDQVLKSLLVLIQDNSKLQRHIINHGIWFENLAHETVADFKQRLHELHYPTYSNTDVSVHLRVSDTDVDGLLKILMLVLQSKSELAKSLWASGLSLHDITTDQANDLKKVLEADAAVVTIIDSAAQFYVSGQILWSDNSPWMESGHRLEADDVISATTVVSLGSSSAPDSNGHYTLSYNWTSTQGRNGPNLRVRLLDRDGAVIAEATKPFARRSMGQAVKTHLHYTPSDLVLTASVRFLRRPGRSLAE